MDLDVLTSRTPDIQQALLSAIEQEKLMWSTKVKTLYRLSDWSA